MSIAADSSTVDPTLASALRALGPDASWIVDVVPLLRRDSDTPDARYAFILIMAESVRILADLLTSPAADHAATLIAGKVQDAIDSTGITPATLIIRGRALAQAVQDALPHLTIEPVDTLADIFGPVGPTFIDESLHLRHAMDGDTIPHSPAAAAPLWSSWGVPLPDVAAFFAAAAALYHAANSRGCSSDADGALFILDTPSTPHTAGHEAIVTLMGSPSPSPSPSTDGHIGGAGNSGASPSVTPVTSVTIYAAPEDWDAMVESARTNPIAADVRYPVMALTYVSADALGAAALAEIHTHGWEVATPAAYPWVWFLNMIGGGLTTPYLHTVTAQLNAVARAITPTPQRRQATSTSLYAHFPLPPLNTDLILRYTDRATGITVRTIAT